MPLLLLIPPAILTIGALVALAAQRLGSHLGRWPAAASSWLALAALGLVWPTGRRVDELSLSPTALRPHLDASHSPLAAVPALQLQGPLLALLLTAALLLAGALPGLEWTRAEIPVAAALVVPIGFHIIVRVYYGLVAGDLDQPWLDRTLAVTGVTM